MNPYLRRESIFHTSDSRLFSLHLTTSNLPEWLLLTTKMSKIGLPSPVLCPLRMVRTSAVVMGIGRDLPLPMILSLTGGRLVYVTSETLIHPFENNFAGLYP